MKIALVVMAAGIGTRYGGDKQIDTIGPHGEMLMEYSVYDAIRAGFSRVVFIIQPSMENIMRDLCGWIEKQHTPEGEPVEVSYAFQDFSSLPEFFTVPWGRVKPFGTVHALLCAEECVHEPFCVINADDYYGISAYESMAQALHTLAPEGEAVMVGYSLANTASLHGSVSRGLCTVKDGLLCSVDERKHIQLYPNGRLMDLDTGYVLAPDMITSMNFWGFMPSIFPALRRDLEQFLAGISVEEMMSAERVLPVMIDNEIRAGRLRVSVLHSGDVWFGMTYRQDRAAVREDLWTLHKRGYYPACLRA